ncbi:prostate stem cell antigen-like [Anolis carolinensis]|uniref:prostate stem cell antigen-like n=1 Tax=Anolis carolinensis TaxID=28377 RepID=UPI002F2B6C47
MSKLFFLSFWLCLSFEMAGSLQCYKCFRERAHGKCPTTEKPCIAKPGESCFRQKVVTEGVPLYISAGCALNCKAVSAGQHIYHINICCSKDLCNSPSSSHYIPG